MQLEEVYKLIAGSAVGLTKKGYPDGNSAMSISSILEKNGSWYLSLALEACNRMKNRILRMQPNLPNQSLESEHGKRLWEEKLTARGR